MGGYRKPNTIERMRMTHVDEFQDNQKAILENGQRVARDENRLTLLGPEELSSHITELRDHQHRLATLLNRFGIKRRNHRNSFPPLRGNNSAMIENTKEVIEMWEGRLKEICREWVSFKHTLPKQCTFCKGKCPNPACGRQCDRDGSCGCTWKKQCHRCEGTGNGFIKKELDRISEKERAKALERQADRVTTYLERLRRHLQQTL